MKPPPFRYEKASSIQGLLALLADQGEAAKILAGGQSLVPMLNLRLTYPEVLIDINGLDELDYVRVEGDKVKIGALTRHRTLRDSPIIAEHCPLMAEAYQHVAHVTVRNRGTIGGNLSHADPASEMPAVAQCLDATLLVSSKAGQRQVAASDFFLGALTTALDPSELLTEVQIPVCGPGQGCAFEEVSPRQGDFAMAGVAVTLDLSDGACQSVRIAHCGVEERSSRASAVEASLAGKPAGAAHFAEAAALLAGTVEPTESYHADAELKRDLLRSLTVRALTRAAARAGR